MKVLVFGGAGFIGSHVADALTAAGHDVTIFDRRPSPYAQTSQKGLVGDILDLEQVRRAMVGHDVVYQFAGLASLDRGVSEPLETVKQNILGTVTTLEAARVSGIKRYVYASTVYVYSTAGSFYRCSKQAAELYIEEYQRLHGLDHTILRYGTVYGPRADDGNSVRKYLRQALRDRRVSVEASGDEVREYIHVKDAARSSVHVLGDEFRNEHVVLTGHHAMRFKDLLHMIREIVGSDVAIELRGAGKTETSKSTHYMMTPYAFRPKIARKLVNNPYLDMGQGLLECLEEIHSADLAERAES
jgi:UDP-glucose 4-epimerase